MENILNNEYDFIFSIGEACSCTSVLRNSGLQFESYPLDWIWGGNIELRTMFLINNFDGFFNKDSLKLVGNRQNPHPHPAQSKEKHLVHIVYSGTAYRWDFSFCRYTL